MPIAIGILAVAGLFFGKDFLNSAGKIVKWLIIGGVVFVIWDKVL